jgi:hypothetical protein
MFTPALWPKIGTYLGVDIISLGRRLLSLSKSRYHCLCPTVVDLFCFVTVIALDLENKMQFYRYSIDFNCFTVFFHVAILLSDTCVLTRYLIWRAHSISGACPIRSVFTTWVSDFKMATTSQKYRETEISMKQWYSVDFS